MIDVKALPKIAFNELSFPFERIPWLTDTPYLAVLSDCGNEYHIIAMEKQNLIYEKIGESLDWVVRGGHHGIQEMLKEYCYFNRLFLIEFNQKPVELNVKPCIEHLSHDAIRFIMAKPYDQVKAFFKKSYSPFGTFRFNDFMNSLAFLINHFDVIEQNGQYPAVKKHMRARSLATDWNEMDYKINDALEIFESCLYSIPQVKMKE